MALALQAKGSLLVWRQTDWGVGGFSIQKNDDNLGVARQALGVQPDVPFMAVCLDG